MNPLTWPDKEIALQQIQRMAQLDTFPGENKHALHELVKAAMYADSLKHLEATIDKVMFSETVCPKPAELRWRIDATRDPEKGEPEDKP